MLRLNGLVNNNYSPTIGIVQHGGPRVSSYLQLILFVRRVYIDKVSEKLFDKNNRTYRAYINIIIIQ